MTFTLFTTVLHPPFTTFQSGLDPRHYSLRTRNTVTRLDPSRINMDLVLDLLLYVSKNEEFAAMQGSVLVFLPGLSHIQELYELLVGDRHFADKKK